MSLACFSRTIIVQQGRLVANIFGEYTRYYKPWGLPIMLILYRSLVLGIFYDYLWSLDSFSFKIELLPKTPWRMLLWSTLVSLSHTARTILSYLLILISTYMMPIPSIFNTNGASIDLLAAMLRNRFTDSSPSRPFMFDIPSAKHLSRL